MSPTSLVDRLAALPSLAAIPRAQLAWLADHGDIVRYAAGVRAFVRGEPLPDLYVLLDGRLSARVLREGISRKVMEWGAGAVFGFLPYSRMKESPVDGIADATVEMLRIRSADLAELVRECPQFTALCVHEMIDRARTFRASDLQDEKLASLGKMSAALAHEMNNPSSAIIRSVTELADCRREIRSATRELMAVCLTSPQREAMRRLEQVTTADVAGGRSAVQRADQEDALAAWFEARRIDVRLAEALVDTEVTIEMLEEAAVAVGREALEALLLLLAADVQSRRVSTEIERAARRIHDLVATMKRYTHMDRAPVLEEVDLETMLRDTVTLFGAKARDKSVRVDLDTPSDLPAILGMTGELNQVWGNLLDNALDAARPGGHVTITARREDDHVRVSVVDDGSGIAPENLEKIFHPFFTTKAVGEGTGLGLDIVQSIVRQHGGSIEVSSAPGRTEFRVRLPLGGSAA